MQTKPVHPRFFVGQKVVIKPISAPLSTRDSTLEPYVGEVGEVANYFSISPRAGQVFYIYSVRIGADRKELALHEDEIEANV